MEAGYWALDLPLSDLPIWNGDSGLPHGALLRFLTLEFVPI